MPYQPRATFDNPYGSQVSFRTLDVLPPAAYYVNLDDQIVFKVYTDYNPSSFQVVVRMLSPQGVIMVEARQLASTVGSYQELTSTLTGIEGYILSACVSAPNVPLGAAYTTVTLQRSPYVASRITTALLVSGHVSDKKFLSYPTSLPTGPASEVGYLVTRFVTVGTGQDWSVTAPSDTRWRLVTGYFGLTTTAAAPSRLVTLLIKDPSGNQVSVYPAFTTQAASLTYYYTISPGGAGVFEAPYVTIPTANEVLGENGFGIGTATANLQPGDVFSSVSIQVQEWIGV
jgi:hypothetical protein